MKDIFFLFFSIILVFKLYPSGTTEIPENYLDMGKLYITNAERAIYEIPLQYWKPEGITRINTLDLRGIRIHKMILDGKRVKPVNGFLFNSSIFREDQTAEVADSGKYYTVMMRLRMFLDNYLDKDIGLRHVRRKLGPGLFYETRAEKDGYLKVYWIPYGTKEVYINYSICVLKPDEIMEYDIIEADKTIRLELEWE